ncbi:peptide/nickel transport system permease protein [Halogranum rubrum]|uniref:Peptide/nickel transport system permease protein n=1 Tax=Halogranum rubrum TaxID=553466 RepID=A0A1I4BCH1_9EURY|nr:ABC transporter permease [Halogranum rubrum]SFK66474.1 peptide/nickel transport system permease protein [Halogranum rubrum]
MSRESPTRSFPGERGGFDTVADSSLTRSERVRRLLDLWLAAPLRVVWNDARARIGATLLFGFLLMGFVGPQVIAEPSIGQAPQLLGPFHGGIIGGSWYTLTSVDLFGVSVPWLGLEWLLGTDSTGRGILEQVVHATPRMFTMIATAGLFVTALGTSVGALAGYSGGRVDQVLSTVIDIVMTLPGLPLLLILVALLEPKSPVVLGLVLSLQAWAGMARAIRSQVLTIRSTSYVEAAQAMGLSTPTIVAKEVVPNIMPFVMINMVNAMRGVIFASVGLYFLGLLPFSEVVNWGVMLQLAYSNGGMLTLDAAHWLLVPMLAIVLLSMALILFAQGMDRVFNPRVRARHANTTGGSDDDTEPTEPKTRAVSTEGNL